MNRYVGIGIVLAVILGVTSYSVMSNPDVSYPGESPWLFETVDAFSDVGQFVSVAIDPDNGATYISYYDAVFKELRLATFVGSGGSCASNSDWDCGSFAFPENSGKYSSVAVNPVTNQPAIAYLGDSNRLYLAIKSGGTWDFKDIQGVYLGTAGLYASLAIDSTGDAHIAHYASYVGDDELWYVKYVGNGGNCSSGDYQCKVIDSGHLVGQFANLALDSNDRPHIAYADANNNALKYAYLDGSTWKIKTILPTNSGYFASFAVDTENGDRKHIAHYDWSNSKLKYATYVGSGGNCGFDSSSTQFLWQCDDIETVTSGNIPMGISLAVDSNHYPVIVYQSGDSALRIARPAAAAGQLTGNCGPADPFFTWQCDTLSIGFGIQQGDYISHAFNAAGVPTIAYYGNSSATDGDLRIAYRKPFRVFMPFTLDD